MLSSVNSRFESDPVSIWFRSDFKRHTATVRRAVQREHPRLLQSAAPRTHIPAR